MVFSIAQTCANALTGAEEAVSSPASLRSRDSAATALSLVIQASQHAQQLVQSDASLGSISLNVFCKVVKPGMPGSEGVTFTLWGPPYPGNVQTEAALDARQEQRSSPVRAVINALMPADPMSIPNKPAPSGNEPAAAPGYPMSNPSMPVSHTPAGALPDGTNEQLVTFGRPIMPMGTGTAIVPGMPPAAYTVPVNVMAECLSLVLDAVGCTRHMALKRMDMERATTVYCKQVVRKIYLSTLDHLKRSGAAKTRTMRYQSLIPQHLRMKNVYLPSIVLSRRKAGGRPYYIHGPSRGVIMNIEKVTRNAKEKNLALVAVLMHFTPAHLNLRSILREFAVQGFAAEGCKQWTLCAGTSSCEFKRKALVKIYNDDGRQNLIGSGRVDPFTTFLLGRPVPSSCVVTWFSEVREGVVIEDPYGQGISAGNVLSRPFVLSKHRVGRVGLRSLKRTGEFVEIGTAILVREEFVTRDENLPPAKKDGVDGDISNAVIVCDFDLTAVGDVQSMAYPFPEWYQTNQLGKHREQHFFDRGHFPKQVSDLTKVAGFFWHKRLLC